MANHPITNFMVKLRGQQTALPPRASGKHLVLSALGAFIAIGVVAAFSKSPNQMLIMGSFGGTCVLLFGFPDSPFAQPRNVIIGHTLCYSAGLMVGLMVAWMVRGLVEKSVA
jgi:CBS-domain-containing membrane protein